MRGSSDGSPRGPFTCVSFILKVARLFRPATTSETKTSTNENLGDLLLREDILSKVLVHLVDSGLHECRRVCRKWYEVCNKLPVKLNLSLHNDRYFDPDQFSNAVPVKFEDSILSTYSVETQLLLCLSKLNRITHLEFSINEWPCGRSNPLPTLYSMLSLSLSVLGESAFIEFLETLRCLTGLTALELRTRNNRAGIDFTPITEMKQLRNLKTSSCFVVNQNNEFIFGTQTQLTKLEIVQEFHSVSRTVISLQVMSVPL